MRRLGAVLAVVLLLGGCSADDEPAARPTPPEPSDTIGVLPEDDAARDRGRSVPPGVVAGFGVSFGTLCTGSRGGPSPPAGGGVVDQVSDLRRVDGLTVARELTLYRDPAAVRAWLRRFRADGPCTRVDGLRVTTSGPATVVGDPRVPPRLPAGTLLRRQVLRTNGSTDPVLLVDVVSRLGDAVIRTQVMQLDAPSGAADVPRPGRGTAAFVRLLDDEARDGVRLLERLRRATARR